MKSYLIEFEPIGRRGECPAEQSLLAAAQSLGVDIASLCGGRGTCHRCKVQLLNGTVSPTTKDEKQSLSRQELERGYRLACQTYPLSDCKLYVPAESLTALQRTQVEGMEVRISPDPPVHTYAIDMERATLDDVRADAEHVIRTLKLEHNVPCRTFDIETLRQLPTLLRSHDWRIQVSLRGDEIVCIHPPSNRPLGFAIDMGTTKVAGYLVDMDTGQTLSSKGIMNPQIAYGEDIISRIALVSQDTARGEQLHKATIKAINKLAVDLCAEIGAEVKEIVETVVVGNTAMHHLLLQLPVSQLSVSPFVPAVSHALDVKARDIGIKTAPGAYVHLPPNIAGFVGADHVAMLLATDAWQADKLTLAMDIGTNTEIALSKDGYIASVSCASGPAFEGAHIEYGMRAAPGAIERLQLTGYEVRFQTIGGTPPIGLCGSGILDALAQLRTAGVVDSKGRLGNHPRVRTIGGKREFVIVSDEELKRLSRSSKARKPQGYRAISITQNDVRELQLAKAAIRTGINVLLDSGGFSASDIRRVIIAGAFGTYIDVNSAMTVGMLPRLPIDRIQQVGNAAGMGAKLALISKGKRHRAQQIAESVKYIELSTAPNFTKTFTQATLIGED